MMTIPLALNNTFYTLFVILEAENVTRLRANDPAEIVLDKLGQDWAQMILKDVVILMPSNEDLQIAMDLFKADKAKEAMRYLTRGWHFRPDQGDHDLNYTSLIE